MHIVQDMAAIGTVMALMTGSLWWLRKRGMAALPIMRRPADRRLRSLERLPLSAQHTLHLIRLEDTTLLLACTPAGCAVVHTVPGQRTGPEPER